MGLSFEARLREAEQTINTLVETIKREGGSVYICDRDNPQGFDLKLTSPISITYWMPIKRKVDEQWLL
jgi:hypothetical protein